MNSPLLFRQARTTVEALGAALSNIEQEEPQINALLADATRALKECYDITQREINMEKRRQLKSEWQQLQSQYLKSKQRYEQHKTERDRQTLLASEMHQRIQKPSEDSMQIFMEQNQALLNTGGQLDTFIGIGRTTLDQLSQQRSLLKSTHRRLLDAVNRLGLSQSIIKVIEMRTQQDKYIFWGGLACTIFLMYSFWRYWFY